MLVVTRRKKEIVDVMDQTGKPLGFVKVVLIKGDRVRLGFVFPRSYPVHRREVTLQIQAEAEESQKNSK